MSENHRALALELAIKANPPVMNGSTPGPQSSGSFYTVSPHSDKILKDAAAFLTFLAPEKPKPSPKSRKAR